MEFSKNVYNTYLFVCCCCILFSFVVYINITYNENGLVLESKQMECLCAVHASVRAKEKQAILQWYDSHAVGTKKLSYLRQFI